jgi:DNA adenine methylase
MFIKAKPFLKWAGGKTQLISEIEKNLPKTDVDTYIEPFVGSGAVLFWLLGERQEIKKVVINDINEDLITTYKTIQSAPQELITLLENIQNEYHSLENLEEKKKEYYYFKRELFNGRKQCKIEQSALFIFLNRACFNGLYRVNRKNEFNVPIGSYKKPTICDKSNIRAVSEVLQKVEILCGDFEQTLEYTKGNTLFYIDPPYKPLSDTSSFNSYSMIEFDDNEQIRLKNFCDRLDALGHKWVLSNSDVNGTNEEDRFFDDLYSKYIILRVNAKRSINANPDKRGFLKELLITNKAVNI